MDTTCTYLGLSLKNPFVVGASPQSDDLQLVLDLQAAGAAAIITHSLFEEQIQQADQKPGELYKSASTFFPGSTSFSLSPATYAQHIRKLKDAVNIPVIGSLNGTTPQGWLRYAKVIEDAGAAALELNVYSVAVDPAETGAEQERRVVDVVQSVRGAITIPLAVKLSPFYSAIPNLARRLVDAGADGLVLFNRSYYPSIDLEELIVTPMPDLSGSWELPLRLRWLGILYSRVNASLAVTGGVHTADDAAKAILAGADCIQLVSVLLQRGPNYLKELLAGLQAWMAQHRFESLNACTGMLSLSGCPDPLSYERGTYAMSLQGWNKAKTSVRPHDPLA